MIKGLKIANAFSDNIVMRLDQPFVVFSSNIPTGGIVEQGPYYLFSINGLDPGEAVINETENTILDGGSFNSSRRPSKELSLVVILEETLPMYVQSASAQRTIQYAKDKLRQYFPIAEKIDILFAEDNYDPNATTKKYAFYKGTGYVKNITYDTFSKTCAAQITIRMIDPYFYFVSTETSLTLLTDTTSASAILPQKSIHQLMPDSNYAEALANHELPIVDSKEITLSDLNYTDATKIYYNVEIKIANDITATQLSNAPVGDIIFYDTDRQSSNRPWSKDGGYLAIHLKQLLNYAEFKTRGLIGMNITHGTTVYNSGATLRLTISDFKALLSATGYPEARTKQFRYTEENGVGQWWYGSLAITTEELRYKYGLTITAAPRPGDYNYWGIYYENGDIITLSSEPGKRDLGIRYIDSASSRNTTHDMSISGILEVGVAKEGDQWPIINKNKRIVYGTTYALTSSQFNPGCAISYQIGPVFISFYKKRSGL